MNCTLISELPCLGSVLEFLPLHELRSAGTLSRTWHSATSVCPLPILDTVGFSISTAHLLSMIEQNEASLVVLRVSVSSSEIDRFVSQLIPQLSRMPCLQTLSVFEASPDGGVRINMKQLTDVERFCKIDYSTASDYDSSSSSSSNITSLVLGCDISYPSVTALLRQCITPNLRSLAFLRGCGSLTEKDLGELVGSLNLPGLKCMHFGDCSSEIDMDPVLAKLLARASSLAYIQWSNAGASVEMMKSLVKHEPRIQCEFEGVGFVSRLL